MMIYKVRPLVTRYRTSCRRHLCRAQYTPCVCYMLRRVCVCVCLCFGCCDFDTLFYAANTLIILPGFLYIETGVPGAVHASSSSSNDDDDQDSDGGKNAKYAHEHNRLPAVRTRARAHTCSLTRIMCMCVALLEFLLTPLALALARVTSHLGCTLKLCPV